MTDRIERELRPARPADGGLADADRPTGDGWLADEVELELRPGGEASFRIGGDGADRLGRGGRTPPTTRARRLAFWWAHDGEPATASS